MWYRGEGLHRRIGALQTEKHIEYRVFSAPLGIRTDGFRNGIWDTLIICCIVTIICPSEPAISGRHPSTSKLRELPRN